jgi:hypothetical protein
MNMILTGDVADLRAVGPETIVGILVVELVPSVAPLEAFGSLERLYRHVAEGVGTAPWGAVALSLPADHAPSVLPLQVAFEIRPAVEAAAAACDLPAARRHVLCTVALADALRQVQGAIEMPVALTLALEVVFGMAKLVPMSRRAFEAAARGGGAPA